MLPRPRPGSASHPGPCRIVPDLASPASSHSLRALISPASAGSLGPPIPLRSVAGGSCLGSRATGGTVATLSVLRPLPGVGPLPGPGLLAHVGLPGLVDASPVLALRSLLLGRTLCRSRRAFLGRQRRGNHEGNCEAQCQKSESDRHFRVSHINIPDPGAPGLQVKDDPGLRKVTEPQRRCLVSGRRRGRPTA